MKHPELAKPQRQTASRQVAAGARGEGGMGSDRITGMGLPFGGNENVWKLDSEGGCTTVSMY